MFRFAPSPALWGFIGSLIYAAGRLGSVLSGEAKNHYRAVRKAWFQFAVAIVFGPAAAQAFGPTIVGWIGDHAKPEAVYFTIGLSINSIWPTIEQIAWPSLLAWLGNQLQTVGKAMTGADKK